MISVVFFNFIIAGPKKPKAKIKRIRSNGKSLKVESLFPNVWLNSIIFFNSDFVYYFYCLMKGMKEQLDALGSSGSTFTNVNKNKFENMEVEAPSEKILIEFAKQVESNFKLILTLQKQNTKLREARDILLPRLMSGEIEV